MWHETLHGTLEGMALSVFLCLCLRYKAPYIFLGGVFVAGFWR